MVEHVLITVVASVVASLLSFAASFVPLFVKNKLFQNYIEHELMDFSKELSELRFKVSKSGDN